MLVHLRSKARMPHLKQIDRAPLALCNPRECMLVVLATRGRSDCNVTLAKLGGKGIGHLSSVPNSRSGLDFLGSR